MSSAEVDKELEELRKVVKPDVFDKLAEVLGRKIDFQVPEEDKSVKVAVEGLDVVPAENRDYVPAAPIAPGDVNMEHHLMFPRNLRKS
eukprot:3658065-Amphidinium_carterae.1